MPIYTDYDNREMEENARRSLVAIHKSSYVHASAEIGRNTTIWHFCHVCKGASIGINCRIGQNCYIGPGVKIGNNVKIQNNVSIYEGVTIEDDVFIGPSVVFTNVLVPRSMFRAKGYLKTVVETGATIGANATIVCGNNIGMFSFIGAGSVITKPVKNNNLVYGNPSRVHGSMTVIGINTQKKKGTKK